MLIRRLSHSPFSHVDVILPNGNALGASDSPDAPVVEGNKHGVAIRPPNYQVFGIRRQAVIVTPFADAIIAKVMTQLGKPFDGDALHTFLDDRVFDRSWRNPTSWFCSELFAWAFEAAGYWAPQELLWPKSRVSPTDLLMMFMFDPAFVNKKSFWDQIEKLERTKKER